MMVAQKAFLAVALLVLATVLSPGARSAHSDEGEEMAKKLANPVAALISVPVDFDYDRDLGPREEGERWTVVTKPVIPITLNPSWT